MRNLDHTLRGRVPGFILQFSTHLKCGVDDLTRRRNLPAGVVVIMRTDCLI